MSEIDPVRANEIDAIFQVAVDLPPDLKAGFLVDACRGDAALRREVESLLQAHDRAGDFIERSASDIAAEFIAETGAPGSSVGRYQVLSSVGSGGMGDVFLAEDSQLGRKVALKFLSSRFRGTEDDGLRWFRQEAMAASALNHPNILTVYEIGRWRTRAFIATEYVDGVTLRARMRRRRLSSAAAIDIAAQIAGALSAAHGAGIVHRDIKPENVMVRRDGLIKVLDFGIATVAEPSLAVEQTATTPGAVVGTTAYMSPEQARGEPVDVRTDIWSLGVVLFEMIAGRPPFYGDTPSAVVAAILGRAPDALGRGRRDLPAGLQSIVTRALAKMADDRYERVEDMAEDLRKIRAKLGEDVNVSFSLPRAVDVPPWHRRRGAAAAATVLLVTVAAMSGALWLRRSVSPDTTIQSLAVIPFVNGSGSSDTEYLSDGITDGLIDHLAKLPDLKVMSHTSVFRYKNGEVDARTIGSALHVQAVLTGRVAERGDRVSITVELVDAHDNSHLWGEHYDRQALDLPALHEEVTRDVSRRLRPRMAGTEQRLAKGSPSDPQAYQRYLKGRFYVLKATRPEIDTGVSYLRQAIEIDPSYARAYVGLADAYRVLALAGESPASEEFPRAKTAAAKALDIDERLADAHAILGSVIFWYDWKWDEAERHLKRALELDPSSAEAHEAYGNLLSYTRRHPEALAEIRRASELDPLNLRIGALEGAFLVNAGRADEASVKLAQTLQLEPNYWFARQYAASASIDQHMYDTAVAEAGQALRTSGASTRPAAFLGFALARSGRRAEARGELDQLLRLSAQRYVSPYNIAMIYEGLEDHAEALAWLERGYQEREPRMVFLQAEPKWSRLRSDPRFRDLLQRIGFVP